MSEAVFGTETGVPTFADLRPIWKDPEWLSLGGRAFDNAPRKAFLVLDDVAIQNTSASTFEALTGPSLGNKIVICELCFDIFDSERKTHGRRHEGFMLREERTRGQVTMRLSTHLRKMLSEPNKYGIHLQHVREYDRGVIHNEVSNVRDNTAIGLFVACAAYFNRPDVKRQYDMTQVLLVTERPELQRLAEHYAIPWTSTDKLLSYNAKNH